MSGLTLALGSCVSDLAYYAMDILGDSLPDLLESALAASV
jgi:hypothetical protein